eukprot:270118_1
MLFHAISINSYHLISMHTISYQHINNHAPIPKPPLTSTATAPISHTTTSSCLDSFMILNGLQHLYYTLINFSFAYSDNVFTNASYRVLYMLFEIFSSLTHELVESDPLYTRCKPRHNTPTILKIRTV